MAGAKPTVQSRGEIRLTVSGGALNSAHSPGGEICTPKNRRRTQEFGGGATMEVVHRGGSKNVLKGGRANGLRQGGRPRKLKKYVRFVNSF